MNVITNPNIVYFDIDGTLINWDFRPEEDGEQLGVVIHGPLSHEVLVGVNEKILFRINQHWTQGHHVVLWSAAGVEWVQAVVDAIGIKEQIHTIQTKPKWMYDDMAPVCWTAIIDPGTLR